VRMTPRVHLSGHDVIGGGLATDIAITADGEFAIVGTQQGLISAARFSTLSGGYLGPLLATTEPYWAQHAPAVATGSDGAVYADVHTTVGGDAEWMYAWNADRSFRVSNFRIDSSNTRTGVRHQLVVSGDGMDAAYLMGPVPQPTVSTELSFLRSY
jgi:hypothetical protein